MRRPCASAFPTCTVRDATNGSKHACKASRSLPLALLLLAAERAAADDVRQHRERLERKRHPGEVCASASARAPACTLSHRSHLHNAGPAVTLTPIGTLFPTRFAFTPALRATIAVHMAAPLHRVSDYTFACRLGKAGCTGAMREERGACCPNSHHEEERAQTRGDGGDKERHGELDEAKDEADEREGRADLKGRVSVVRWSRLYRPRRVRQT